MVRYTDIFGSADNRAVAWEARKTNRRRAICDYGYFFVPGRPVLGSNESEVVHKENGPAGITHRTIVLSSSLAGLPARLHLEVCVQHLSYEALAH
jgi:hypothetical protein